MHSVPQKPELPQRADFSVLDHTFMLKLMPLLVFVLFSLAVKGKILNGDFMVKFTLWLVSNLEKLVSRVREL